MTERRDSLDWALFAALSCVWTSAYALTRIAVQDIPPGVIIPVRMTIGAIVLLGVMAAMGQKLPALGDVRRWRAIVLMGLLGMTGPFYLIAIAQQTVDSSLAALYTAATPIFVAIGAHFAFRDDRMTAQRATGVAVGFVGVAVLFAPEVARNFGAAGAGAQVLLVIAVAGYAASALVARAAPPMPRISFAAGFVTVGAILAWPLLLGRDLGAIEAGSDTILAVLALGLGPSALASLLYMALIQRTSATFLSLTGYAIPILSALLGYLAFGETQSWNAIAAFFLILAGVWLAQRPAPVRAESVPRSPSRSTREA